MGAYFGEVQVNGRTLWACTGPTHAGVYDSLVRIAETFDKEEDTLP